MYERDSYTPPRPAPRPRPNRALVITVSVCLALIAAVLIGTSLLFDGAFAATGGADDHPHISPQSARPGPPVPQPVRTCP